MKKVNIIPLLEIADTLQAIPLSDTEYYLASKLFASLEAWETALGKSRILDYELTYWLSFDTFHCANALKMISSVKHVGLNKIHRTMKKVMNEYSPSELEVVL